MATKHITKVSLKAAGEGGVKLTYETFDEGGQKGTTNKDQKNPPAKSLIDSLQALKGHMCIIAEEVNTSKVKKYSDLKLHEKEEEKFRICGVTISHQGTEKESIIITGYKTLETGLGFVFNTPGVRVESETDTAYPHIAELLEVVEVIKKEADEYLHGKYATVQGDLFDKDKKEEI